MDAAANASRLDSYTVQHKPVGLPHTATISAVVAVMRMLQKEEEQSSHTFEEALLSSVLFSALCVSLSLSLSFFAPFSLPSLLTIVPLSCAIAREMRGKTKKERRGVECECSRHALPLSRLAPRVSL